MPRELDEIYINVVARTEKAQEKLNSLAKSFDKTEEKLKKQTKELNRKADLRNQFDAATKEEQRALKEILKTNGEILSRRKTLLNLAEKILKSNEAYKKSLKDAKKDAGNREAAKQVIQMQKLQRYVKQVKAEQQDYYEFLKRAGMENARFSDRLDKRDRTRSLIENMRRGMDKGAAISMRFHAEENAIYRLERSIGIASSAFDRARHPAEALTDAFYRFQRITYTVQTILGVLFATVGDLVGGMMALVGVAGAAAGSLAAVAGSFANLAAGMMTAKFALSGVGAAVQQLWQGQTDYNKALRDAKQAFRDLRFEAEDAALSEQEAAIALEKARESLARVQDLPADSRARRESELEFQRAELNYRRAKARTKDTNDELRRGPQGANPAQNPFNNLTKSQIAFAKYLATLKPVVQSLKEAAASSFLPPLQKSIQVMVENLVPALREGLNSIGAALGDASRNFTDAFKDTENIQLFRDFLENSKPTLRILGAVANKAFGGILVVLRAAQPITDRFARWVYSVAEGFESWAKSGGEEKLRKFFKLSGDVSANLGQAFKLVFGGLSNIVKATFPNGANSGAGGVILQWLKEIGAGFKLFTSGNEFAGWLTSTTENSKAALGTLGSFLKIFLDLAASPDNKLFWMTIRDSVPYLRKILEDGLKAGPAFARLVNAIAAFVALLSETGAMQVFFETLAAIVNTVTAFLRPFKPLLDLLGQAHGAFLALALAGVLFRKVAQIIMGIMMKLTRVAGAATAGFLNLQGKLAAVRGEGNLAASGFRGMISSVWAVGKQLRSLKLEATNLKRIEFLSELAKTEKGKQIAEIRAKMEALKHTTGNTKKETAKLQAEIDELNASYKRLKAELRAGAKDAKTFGDLLGQSAVKADAARFSLDKYGKTQDRLRLAGRFGRAGLLGGVGLASGFQAAQTASVPGGIGAGLMMAGGALSFLPGAGMILGLGASIVGSIVDGFDRANKEAEAAKEQKRIEIKARIAEIQAEKVNQVATTQAAFLGMGFDALKSGQIANNIIKSTEKLISAQGALIPSGAGFTAEAVAASLSGSETLQGLLANTATRGAVLSAAVEAARQEVGRSKDADGNVIIDPNAVATFLEQKVGDKTGTAAAKALQKFVDNNKGMVNTISPSTGKVVSLPEDVARRNAAVPEMKEELDPKTNELRRRFSAMVENQPVGSNVNPYTLATKRETAALAKLLGVTSAAVVAMSGGDLREAIQAKIAKNVAQTTLSFPSSSTPKPLTKDESLDRQFRAAMATIGKPKPTDPIPKPTATFYQNSLMKTQTLINTMNRIEDKLGTTTTQTIELRNRDGKIISTYEINSAVGGGVTGG